MVKKAALYLAIAAVSILVLEMALRILDPINIIGYTMAYEYDPELGVVAKKDLHYINLKDYREEFHTNKLGTVNYADDFGKYSKIVYAVGDSFTQGTGLPSDASYPAQLDMMLNLRGGTYNFDYGVVNLGLGGYGSIQELAILKRFAKVLPPPDYILVMGCNNDDWDDYRITTGLLFKNPMEGNPRYGIFWRPVTWFAFKTELGKHIFTALKNLAQMKSKGVAPSGGEQKGGGEPMVTKLYPQYESIIQFAKKYNAKVIFSFTTSPERIDENYKTLKQWAGEHDAAFADWAPMAASVKHAIPQMPINNDHSAGHYRPWMNYVIARGFAQEIIRQ